MIDEHPAVFTIRWIYADSVDSRAQIARVDEMVLSEEMKRYLGDISKNIKNIMKATANRLPLFMFPLPI